MKQRDINSIERINNLHTPALVFDYTDKIDLGDNIIETRANSLYELFTTPQRSLQHGNKEEAYFQFIFRLKTMVFNVSGFGVPIIKKLHKIYNFSFNFDLDATFNQPLIFLLLDIPCHWSDFKEPLTIFKYLLDNKLIAPNLTRIHPTKPSRREDLLQKAFNLFDFYPVVELLLQNPDIILSDAHGIKDAYIIDIYYCFMVLFNEENKHHYPAYFQEMQEKYQKILHLLEQRGFSRKLIEEAIKNKIALFC